MDTDLIKRIYQKLGDEKSKGIFANRLLYSMTDDARWIHKNIRKYTEGGAGAFWQIAGIQQ